MKKRAGLKGFLLLIFPNFHGFLENCLLNILFLFITGKVLVIFADKYD